MTDPRRERNGGAPRHAGIVIIPPVMCETVSEWRYHLEIALVPKAALDQRNVPGNAGGNVERSLPMKCRSRIAPEKVQVARREGHQLQVSGIPVITLNHRDRVHAPE